jgi:peroxiredoxin Q/BCP
MTKVNVGEKAPNFILPNQDGEMVSLSDYYEKKNVVLFFYPKDFSPGCTTQACYFRDSYEDFTDLGAEVVGVSSDSVESHKKFLDEYLLPFQLLSDDGGKVRKGYGSTKGFGFLPGRYTFIIDKEGVVRHLFTSETDMKKHIDEALRVLRLLMKN